MFKGGFNTSKCETTCRLCVGRIKLIRNKKTLLLKQSQKDIAEQLRNGKQEYARIRVEGVIREKLMLQAFEILELYLELLTVRTQLIAKTKELPRDMMEAVSSIIYAAQRINDLPELATLRSLFAAKYGKEYAAEAAADATASRWQVNANLVRCLLVEAPQPEEKLAMLSEIAQEHGVEWDLSAAAREMGLGGPGAGGGPPHIPASLGSDGQPGLGPGGPTGGYAAPGAVPGGPGVQVPAAVHGQYAAHPQYASAQQAAAAAASAAAQAHAAAQYAAQVAAMTPPPGHGPGAGGGGGGQQSWLPSGPFPAGSDGIPFGAAAHPPAGGMPPPPAGGPAAFVRSTPSPPLHDDGPPLPPSVPNGAPANGSAAGAGGVVGGPTLAGGYIVRSNSDIQRDYDAALGPPVKGATAAPAAPPAPLAVPPSPPPLPEFKAPPSAPPPPPQVEDEYEELTRRLEALKKS